MQFRIPAFQAWQSSLAREACVMGSQREAESDVRRDLAAQIRWCVCVCVCQADRLCVCVWRVRARLTVLVLHRYSKELEESVHAMKRAVGQEQQRADEAEEKLAAVLSSGHIPLEVPALITDLENQVCAGRECLPRGHARVR